MAERPAPAKGFYDLTTTQQMVLGFLQWYVHEHRHSAIRCVIMMQLHTGEEKVILAQRYALNLVARAVHPVCWSGRTRNWESGALVTLNSERILVTETVQMAA
ncbi:hypothetical protein [Nitrincola schmidtii]|uniref:hypothetical protein n=1 Tax=Nitrincola schmidtii TaxID=1730894 RepID=UPI00124E4C53|nr:hypothetical protein [Nitrincola schmidtii]